MKKRVVVTGSNGLLGQNLVTLLLENDSDYEVFGLSRGKNRSGRNDFYYVDVDVTSQELLRKEIKTIQPHFIVNTAAMTNVDACENDQSGCFDLNVNVVQSLIDVCVEIDAHLIHLSTDFIFDGVKGNYTENSKPNPLSYYGETKLISEQIIQRSKVNHTILRTILVYGLVNDMSRSNIVLWVKESLENNKEVTIVNDQYRTPTYVDDLALACKLSIDKNVTGVFNIASNTLLSIYEIALIIAEEFKLDKSLIKPIATSTLNQAALRPVKTGFDLSKTNTVLGMYPKSFQEDLQKFKLKLM